MLYITKFVYVFSVDTDQDTEIRERIPEPETVAASRTGRYNDNILIIIINPPYTCFTSYK